MVLRQKIVKVVCEWPEFGGTAAGSQWINQPGRDGLVVSCVLALFVLAGNSVLIVSSCYA